LLIENVDIFNLESHGVQIYNTTTNNVTVDINSSTVYGCAETGLSFYKSQETGTFDVNVFNSIISGNGSDLAKAGTHAANITGTIRNCIDSDGTIADIDASHSGCLLSRTATDNETPGAGSWVIFRDITTLPYNLRLFSSVYNDANYMHSTSSGAGMSMPSTDLAGMKRILPYSCGAYEIVRCRPENLVCKSSFDGCAVDAHKIEHPKIPIPKPAPTGRQVLVKSDIDGRVVAYPSVAVDRLAQIENVDPDTDMLMIHDANAPSTSQMEKGVVISQLLANQEPTNIRQDSKHLFVTSAEKNSVRDGVQTKVFAGTVSDSDFDFVEDGKIAIDKSNGRIYFRYDDNWHYVAQTAGFQINADDAFDQVSKKRFEVGDIVIGTVIGFMSDGAPHCEYITLESALKKLGVLKDG
jgi:hypothetical protein